MSPDLILTVLGTILSIALEVVPGLADWWQAWGYKRAAWLVGCFVAAFGLMGLCYAGAPVGFQCVYPFIWDGAFACVQAALAAYYAGQFAYAVTKAIKARGAQ